MLPKMLASLRQKSIGKVKLEVLRVGLVSLRRRSPLYTELKVSKMVHLDRVAFTSRPAFKVGDIKNQARNVSATVSRNLTLLMLLVLSGCGAAQKHVLSELQDSESAYRECLTQANGDATQCATQQQSYQSALQTYEKEGSTGKSAPPSN
jgi:hypothetical protein